MLPYTRIGLLFNTAHVTGQECVWLGSRIQPVRSQRPALQTENAVSSGKDELIEVGGA